MNDRNISIDRSLLRWILLGVSVIGLIVMVVALLAAGGNRFGTVSIAALAVSVVSLAGFVLLDPQSLATALTGRTGMYGLTSVLITALFIFVVVILFILIRQLPTTPIDVTDTGRYGLSQETTDLLSNLEEDVHAVGFYNAQQTAQQEEADLWLRQYAQRSNGKLTYEFVDPDRDPGEAQRLGLTRAGVIIFEQGDRTAEASSASERNLTGALVRVQLGEERVAYFVTGHGEREITNFTDNGISSAADALERSNFAINELNLLAEGGVPEDADLLIVAGPLAQYSEAEATMIGDYLNGGGSGLFMFDPGTGGGQLGNGVLGISYSADGEIIATSGGDGTAMLWDSSSGDELLTLRGHTSDVLDVNISPNGDVIATAGRDGTVRIWDMDTGEELGILDGQTDLVQDIEFTHNGDYLVSIGQDQIINVWDASTFEPEPYSPIATTTPLFALATAPSGNLFATAGARNTATGAISGTVTVWDASTGSEVTGAEVHDELVLGLAFTPDGDTLVSVSRDGYEGRLDVNTGDAAVAPLYPEFGIAAVAIAEDGTRVYALGDNSIRILDADATTTDDEVVLTGHTSAIWTLEMSPDGDHFLSASRDGTARAWSLSRESNTLRLTAHNVGDQLIAYLASDWGIMVNDDFVIDLGTADRFDELTPVLDRPDAYNTASPITAALIEDGIRPTFFVGARSLSVAEDAPDNLDLIPLFYSSNFQEGDSWGETDLNTPNATFSEADNPGPVTMGVSGENAATGARVVVIGDTDFATNFGLSFATGYNGDLVVNSANWLTEGEVFDLPSPNVGQNLLDNPLPQAGLIVVTIAAVCLIPGGVVVAGVIIWFVRRRRR